MRQGPGEPMGLAEALAVLWMLAVCVAYVGGLVLRLLG
jgi:hypothetical protein